VSDHSERRRTLCMMAAVLEGTRAGNNQAPWLETSVELAFELERQVNTQLFVEMQTEAKSHG